MGKTFGPHSHSRPGAASLPGDTARRERLGDRPSDDSLAQQARRADRAAIRATTGSLGQKKFFKAFLSLYFPVTADVRRRAAYHSAWTLLVSVCDARTRL